MEPPRSHNDEADSLSRRLRMCLDVGVHTHAPLAKLQHQHHTRNHSLDYRLNSHPTHHQQQTHHRNRSLDSVLQQIPEVGHQTYQQQPLYQSSSDSVSTLDTPPLSSSASPNPSGPNTDRTSLASDDSGIFNSDDGRMINLQDSTVNRLFNSDDGRMTNLQDSRPHQKDIGDMAEDDESVCDTCELEEGADSNPSLVHQEVVMFPKPPPKESLLLRLFESTLFDMSIAITYLFNSKEPGVQTYLGKWPLFIS